MFVGTSFLIYCVVSLHTDILQVIQGGSSYSFSFIILLVSRLQFLTDFWLLTKKDRLWWSCPIRYASSKSGMYGSVAVVDGCARHGRFVCHFGFALYRGMALFYHTHRDVYITSLRIPSGSANMYVVPTTLWYSLTVAYYRRKNFLYLGFKRLLNL